MVFIVLVSRICAVKRLMNHWLKFLLIFCPSRVKCFLWNISIPLSSNTVLKHLLNVFVLSKIGNKSLICSLFSFLDSLQKGKEVVFTLIPWIILKPLFHSLHKKIVPFLWSPHQPRIPPSKSFCRNPPTSRIPLPVFLVCQFLNHWFTSYLNSCQQSWFKHPQLLKPSWLFQSHCKLGLLTRLSSPPNSKSVSSKFSSPLEWPGPS